MMIKKIAFKAINIAKFIYTPISFVFILYFAWINKTLLREMISLVDLQIIMLAVLLWSSLHLISPLLTQTVLRLFNVPFSYSRLLGIYISRLPARYLPGGIWHTVGRFADYYYCGIPKKQLTLLAVIETLLPALVTFFLGGGYLWVTGATFLTKSIEGALALTSFIILMTVPFLLSQLKMELFPKNHIIYYTLLLLTGLFWIIASLSFICYYLSLSLNLPNNSLATIAAIYIFSWGIGYISIFAPQGIGIFELVAGKLLILPMTLGGVIAFIAGFRIVILIADSLTWGLYTCCGLFLSRSKKSINTNLDKP